MPLFRTARCAAWLGAALLATHLASAQTGATPAVRDAWIRGTVPQQTATGLFAQISSPVATRLVEARSSAAGAVEIHEMRMDGNTMRMRAIEGLDIPAGRSVDLKPGGYHLMLVNLKQPLKAGEEWPVTLVFEAADRSRQTVELKVPVRALNATAAGAGHGTHGGHGAHGGHGSKP